jgi:putative flippase GtrA
VGAVSTVLHLGLFALLHDVFGTQFANTIALLIATIANTALNRHWTFGVSGTERLVSHHGQALFVFVVTWGASAAALALLQFLTTPSTLVATVALGASMAATTVLRFVAMHWWIFRAN